MHRSDLRTAGLASLAWLLWTATVAAGQAVVGGAVPVDSVRQLSANPLGVRAATLISEGAAARRTDSLSKTDSALKVMADPIAARAAAYREERIRDSLARIAIRDSLLRVAKAKAMADTAELPLDSITLAKYPLNPVWKDIWVVPRDRNGPKVLVFPFQVRNRHEWKGEGDGEGILIPVDALDTLDRNPLMRLMALEERPLSRNRRMAKPKLPLEALSWARQDSSLADCLAMMLEMRMDTAGYAPVDLGAVGIIPEEWVKLRAGKLSRRRLAEIGQMAGAQAVLTGSLSIRTVETEGAGCRAWIPNGVAKMIQTSNGAVLRDAEIKVVLDDALGGSCEEASLEALNHHSFELMRQVNGWEKPGSRLKDVRTGAWWVLGLGAGTAIQAHVMHVFTADDADRLQRRGITGPAAYAHYRRTARAADNWGTVAKVGYSVAAIGLGLLGVTYAF